MSYPNNYAEKTYGSKGPIREGRWSYPRFVTKLSRPDPQGRGRMNVVAVGGILREPQEIMKLQAA